MISSKLYVVICTIPLRPLQLMFYEKLSPFGMDHIIIKNDMTGSYGWRQLFDPLIRYCALTYVIEADSFALKHASYQKYLELGDMDSAQPIMFDIMDETMHVRFGQKWVPHLMTHYQYPDDLQALIKACRVIVSKHSVAPAQREAALAHDQ